MRRFGILLIFVLFLGLARTSGAAGDAPLMVPDDYPTIDEAFENVKDGGVISIRPGKYRLGRTLEVKGNITFQGVSGLAEEVRTHWKIVGVPPVT